MAAAAVVTAPTVLAVTVLLALAGDDLVLLGLLALAVVAAGLGAAFVRRRAGWAGFAGVLVGIVPVALLGILFSELPPATAAIGTWTAVAVPLSFGYLVGVTIGRAGRSAVGQR